VIFHPALVGDFTTGRDINRYKEQVPDALLAYIRGLAQELAPEFTQIAYPGVPDILESIEQEIARRREQAAKIKPSGD